MAACPDAVVAELFAELAAAEFVEDPELVGERLAACAGLVVGGDEVVVGDGVFVEGVFVEGVFVDGVFVDGVFVDGLFGWLVVAGGLVGALAPGDVEGPVGSAGTRDDG